MIVGDPTAFAIESSVATAYDRLSWVALGMYVIHVGSTRYGIYEPEASMLACSIDAVMRRLNRRGQHIATFAEAPDALQIADAYSDSIYADNPRESYFGMSPKDFSNAIYSNDIQWCPDGDEAFDDGSHILQFDIGNNVRIIAFRRTNGTIVDLEDLRMASQEFYSVLANWHEAFLAEWQSLPKEPS